jgi:hypothetical protein
MTIETFLHLKATFGIVTISGMNQDPAKSFGSLWIEIRINYNEWSVSRKVLV